MEIRIRHWLAALAVAGAVHASLLIILPGTTQQAVIVTAVHEIDLGSLAGTEDGGDQPDRAELESLESAQQAATLEPMHAEPAHRPPAEASSPLAQPQERILAQPIEPLRPKPTRARPEKPKPKPPETIERKARPAPAPPARARPAAPPKPSLAPDPAKQAGSASPTTAGRESAKGGKSNSNGQSPGGGGKGSRSGTGQGGGRSADAAATRRYYASLTAWLARHKGYPQQARRRQQQGTVKVTFTIDRHGRLLSQRIVASSGHALLDQEALAILQRASPMPAIPAALQRNQLTVTVPIDFSLK